MVENNNINIENLVPYGVVASRKWILSQGVSRHRLDNWIKSNQISIVTTGIYKHPETIVTWEVVAYSMQRMGIDLIPGGVTSFEVFGFGHYIPISKKSIIYLYGEDALPAWINKLSNNVSFIKQKFVCAGFTNEISCVDGRYVLNISSVEKALFEVLSDVPNEMSFEYADQLMQGLVNLSPNRLNSIFREVDSFKVRRLFLWFAERHNHSWYKKIDNFAFSMESGMLGKGKRVIAKNGRLDNKYLITVPKDIGEN